MAWTAWSQHGWGPVFPLLRSCHRWCSSDLAVYLCRELSQGKTPSAKRSWIDAEQLMFRWSVLFKDTCMYSFPPPRDGGKCHFCAVLEWCQEFPFLLRLLQSLFQICFKCSVIHEIHCLWVLFLLKQGSSSKKTFSVVVVNRFRAAATTRVTAGRKTLRAGTKLSFHDMGLSDLQRLKEWVSLRWKEHKQGERLIPNFSKWILGKCLCWGLFCVRPSLLQKTCKSRDFTDRH